MPSRCTAYKCSNNSNDGYALVRYPQNESLRQKWIAAVGRGKSWSPNNTQQLCEIHFQPLEIKFVAGRKQVKLGAVPSRFCTCSIRKKTKYLTSTSRWLCAACKPLTKEDLQTKSQEIKQMDEMQPIDENANSSRSTIIKENEQLRNEMKGTVEEVVKN
ncbi:THAP domain-containing protein 2-like isoform X2 [Temnothorax nylanderi]|uniref:THAP domain-containing protein 2-like isoform X2 n=1 Tax=Temnothorax nylanderi TaxID=102681 RepID=UPI003A8835D3